jgi:hypothetical protein
VVRGLLAGEPFCDGRPAGCWREVLRADRTLWRIDQGAAREAGGWKRFAAPEWGFSAALPGEPEKDVMPVGGGGPSLVHAFSAWRRVGSEPAPTRYTVAVSEYPPEVLAATTEEDRLATGRELALAAVGGKLVSEKPVGLGGRKGVERVVEVEGRGTLHSRLFCVGARLYGVQVAGKPEFLNEKAADYFLDSFRLEEGADRP